MLGVLLTRRMDLMWGQSCHPLSRQLPLPRHLGGGGGPAAWVLPVSHVSRLLQHGSLGTWPPDGVLLALHEVACLGYGDRSLMLAVDMG